MADGLTKAWRSANGGRRLTFREGGTGPLAFTIFMTKNFGLEFVYIALRVGSRWFRWHMNRGIK